MIRVACSVLATFLLAACVDDDSRQQAERLAARGARLQGQVEGLRRALNEAELRDAWGLSSVSLSPGCKAHGANGMVTCEDRETWLAGSFALHGVAESFEVAVVSHDDGFGRLSYGGAFVCSDDPGGLHAAVVTPITAALEIDLYWPGEVHIGTVTVDCGRRWLHWRLEADPVRTTAWGVEIVWVGVSEAVRLGGVP